MAVFTSSWYPGDGSPDPSLGSQPPELASSLWALLLSAMVSMQLTGTGALVQQWSCAAAGDNGGFLLCCGVIKLAGIEDNIPGSLGIPLPAQLLPAREQQLPEAMNLGAHTP